LQAKQNYSMQAKAPEPASDALPNLTH
jgi:hypothetical protein